MDLYEVMRTTFAARDFTEDPISNATIYRILDQARFAGSGGNRQGWKVIVVRDDATRAALKPLIGPTMQRYTAQVRAGENPLNTITPSALTEADIAATPVPDAMIHKLLSAPVLLFIFVDLEQVASMDKDLDRIGVISGGSIYPFISNILLAARNEGYGGTLTTFVGPREKDVQQLLGIPAQMAFAAMLPMGKPKKQLTKLRRNPVETFARLERWDGAPLAP